MTDQLFKGYSSRCTCCNAMMDDQRIKIHNGHLDDLCSTCRSVVSKAVHYHYEDQVALETETWGVKHGGNSLQEDAEATYQGYE